MISLSSIAEESVKLEKSYIEEKDKLAVIFLSYFLESMQKDIPNFKSFSIASDFEWNDDGYELESNRIIINSVFMGYYDNSVELDKEDLENCNLTVKELENILEKWFKLEPIFKEIYFDLFEFTVEEKKVSIRNIPFDYSILRRW